MQVGRVVILSGISGSGKSTYADKLLQQTQGVKVSADHYFISSLGKAYRFDPSKLAEAHADCFRRYIQYLQQKEQWSCVVVDNTGTQVHELSPYVLAAEAFGYQPEVITLWVDGMGLETCAQRNIHGVPKAAIDRQYCNLMQRKLPPYWKQTTIPVQF